jgi:hypothetical protein
MFAGLYDVYHRQYIFSEHGRLSSILAIVDTKVMSHEQEHNKKGKPKLSLLQDE